MTNQGLSFHGWFRFYATVTTIPGWSVMRTEAVMRLVFPETPPPSRAPARISEHDHG